MSKLVLIDGKWVVPKPPKKQSGTDILPDWLLERTVDPNEGSLQWLTYRALCTCGRLATVSLREEEDPKTPYCLDCGLDKALEALCQTN